MPTNSPDGDALLRTADENVTRATLAAVAEVPDSLVSRSSCMGTDSATRRRLAARDEFFFERLGIPRG